jgi:pilus assembly protein CpaB
MGRIRGFVWLAAGLVIAILAGVVAFVTLARASAQTVTKDVSGGATSAVVVAVRAVAVRAALTQEDLTVKELPAEAVPEGAIRKLEDAVGKITLVELYPGEVLLTPRLVDPTLAATSGRLALIVAEDKVLMAFPAQDLLSRIGMLNPGDHVDLLFSMDTSKSSSQSSASPAQASSGSAASAGSQSEKLATFSLLQNLTIAAVVGGTKAEGESGVRNPEAILLTVSAQDALVLKYVKDSGGVLDIVLRAPGAERPFMADPVDMDYIINRYQIPQSGQ